MRVATLVFLFLARICFPKTKSIPSIIWRTNGDKVLIEVRQFEKLDYKLRKVQLYLDFLCKCKESDAIPKFLSFRLPNKKLQDSLTCKNCQRNFLITEISLKKSHLRVLKNKFNLLHSELKSVLNCIDFTHVMLKPHDSIQQKKFNTLFKMRQRNTDQIKLFLTILKFLYLIRKSHY